MQASKISVVSFSLVLLFSSLMARAQVLTVFEVNDPVARRLQQRYIKELQAIGNELQTHHFPYNFYFSKQLDIDEKQQQKIDQRSIHFAKYNNQTMLEITGNYYAAYSASLMKKRERVKRTYEDVLLPILKTAVPKFPPDDSFAGFALEISYHVRGSVKGIETENPENVTLIVPRAVAHRLVTAKNEEQQQAALLDAEVYLNTKPFLLWLNGEPPAELAEGDAPAKGNAWSPAVEKASASLPSSPDAIVSSALLNSKSLPMRLITPDTLSSLQSTHAGTIAQMRTDLDSQAHFVAYAPPAFVAFHQGVYLQLSVNSPLRTSNGSQYQLAALAFDDHISHLIRPVLAYFQQDKGFDGISFSTILKPPTGDSSKAVEFFFPFESLRCFANYDCTGQQLIDSGIVLINGERAGLSLQAAEAITAK